MKERKVISFRNIRAIKTKSWRIRHFNEMKREDGKRKGWNYVLMRARRVFTSFVSRYASLLFEKALER